MSDIELKPCPFCGGPANYCEENEDNHYSGEECHYIECCNCGCFDFHDKKDSESVKDLRDCAAGLWNTRADGWVSVGDRLPNNTDTVLIYIGYENREPVIASSFYLGTRWAAAKDLPITHWRQPLPEPPK